LKNSVIINCYNTLPLIQKTVAAALATTDLNTEILLINNHPPYPEVADYLQSIKHPRTRVLDPGRNLGCTLGFQFGAAQARGEFIVKLDDDTIVPKNNWISAMSQALNDFSDLAYVALIMNIYQQGRNPPVAMPEYTLEIIDDCVFFSCMMIRKQLWSKHFVISKTGLYGGEEFYYMQKATELGLKKGYLLSHVANHLGRTAQADPLYGAWKFFYGVGQTGAGYEEWRLCFTPNENDLNSMRRFGYPEDQIEEIRTLLAKIKNNH
jgi:GT2 family glycosyltransferase